LPQLPGTPAKTTLDYATLKGKYNEIQNQLRNLERRRDGIMQEMNRAPDPGVRGTLEQRLSGINKQILQLESDLGETGRLMTQAAPAAREQYTVVPPPSYEQRRQQNKDEASAVLTGLFIVLVMMPIAVAFARRLWKRGIPQSLPSNVAEMPNRMERLETAIDTIAVEVERISENQRFMTRLMTETQLGSTLASVRASHDAARSEVAEPFESPQVRALGAGEKPFEPIKVNERDDVKIRREG